MLLNDGIAAFTGFNPDMVTALPTDAYGSTYIPEVRESLGMFLLCHGLQGFSVIQAGGLDKVDDSHRDVGSFFRAYFLFLAFILHKVM